MISTGTEMQYTMVIIVISIHVLHFQRLNGCIKLNELIRLRIRRALFLGWVTIQCGPKLFFFIKIVCSWFATYFFLSAQLQTKIYE